MDRHVGIESIERELTALWSDFGTNPEAAPVIRACSMNLVAFVGENTDRGSAEILLNSLTSDHPARAFLVVMDRTAPELETTVAAKCSIPLPGEKQVCSEQITMIAPYDAVSRVPSFISSLLVPDVPVVVWIESGMPSGFEQMISMSDLMILDSAGDRNFSQSRQLMKREPSVKFRDLAWERTEFWRRLTSLLFEKPEVLNNLKKLEAVAVTYGKSEDGPSGESSALLFGGWVIHSLKSSVDQPISPVSVNVTPAHEKTAASGILSVEFVFGDNLSYRVTGKREGECPAVARVSEGRIVSEQVLPLRDVSEVQRISVLLALYEEDPEYRDTLRTLAGQE